MAAKVVLVVLASVLSMACTSSVVGTGEPTPGSGGDAPRTESNGGPSSDPSSSDPGDGVPDSIAALFSPPTSTSSTPDEIFGLWVATDSSWAYGLEARLKISPSSVIFAAKCKSDGEIVHVEVASRASSSKLTLLEAKNARFSRSCYESIELSAGEWKWEEYCGSSGCFEVRDTALSLYVTGLPRTWVKLSD